MNAEKDVSELSEARSHLEQAYAAEEQDDPATALRECELSIQLDSSYAEVHNLHGIVLEELGRKEEAIAAYQEAVRLDPAWGDAQENLVELENELRGGELGEIQNPTQAEEPKYPKIGGWLSLIGIGIVISPLLVLYQIINSIPAFSGETWTMLTTPGTTVYHPMWAPLFVFELLVNIAVLIFGIILVVFFFQKRRVFPKVFIAFLLSNLAFLVIDYLLATSVANSIPVLAGQGSQGVLQIGRSVIVCLIWIPYFLVSKRVKGTFVH